MCVIFNGLRNKKRSKDRRRQAQAISWVNKPILYIYCLEALFCNLGNLVFVLLLLLLQSVCFLSTHSSPTSPPVYFAAAFI